MDQHLQPRAWACSIEGGGRFKDVIYKVLLSTSNWCLTTVPTQLFTTLQDEDFNFSRACGGSLVRLCPHHLPQCQRRQSRRRSPRPHLRWRECLLHSSSSILASSNLQCKNKARLRRNHKLDSLQWPTQRHPGQNRHCHHPASRIQSNPHVAPHTDVWPQRRD